MKNSIIIVAFAILFVISCKTKNLSVSSASDTVDSVAVFYPDSVNDEVVNEAKKEIEAIKSLNIDSVLKANIEIASRITVEDTLYYVVGNKAFYGDNETGQIIAFTRFEKKGNVVAFVSPTSYDDESQPLIKIYALENKNWEQIKVYEAYGAGTSYFEEVDLNNDGSKEIQAIGYPNMNGNYWNNFYSYSKSENSIIDGSGFFSGVFEIKPKESRIEVLYEGSWYMPYSKSIYYWKNHKLIPYKEVEVSLKIADMKHDAQFIKYSENLNLDKDSLEVKYKKTFRGKKLNYFYDNFFENN